MQRTFFDTASKAGAYLFGALSSYPHTLENAEKAWKKQTLQLILPLCQQWMPKLTTIVNVKNFFVTASKAGAYLIRALSSYPHTLENAPNTPAYFASLSAMNVKV